MFKLILKFHFIPVLLLSLYRVIFFFWYANKNHFQEFQFENLKIFFLGIIFDNIIASYISVFPILLSIIFIIFNSSLMALIFNQILKVYYFIAIIFAVFLCLCDFRFFSYFQDHLNIYIFNLFEDDTKAIFQTVQFEIYTYLALIIFIFTTYLCFKKFRKLSFFHSYDRSYFLKNLIISLVLFSLLAIGSRGGISKFPLSTSDATITSEKFFNLVTINPGMAFYQAVKFKKNISSLSNDVTKKFGYQNLLAQAYRNSAKLLNVNLPINSQSFDFLNRKTLNQNSNSPHVVLAIMESFASYWINHHSQSFNLLGKFEHHLNEDYLFKNFISADSGTIGSLISIISNQPLRPFSPVISESEFFDLTLDSAAAKPYKDAGYDTVFIYGGKKGWRNIYQYLEKQYFDTIIGEKDLIADYKLNKDQYNVWGVADEFLFQKIEEILKKSTKPTLIVALSMSNHPPFSTPPGYKPYPLNIPQNIIDRQIRDKNYLEKRFKSFQYANDQLGRFISMIKSDEILSQNTIIGVTGDHSFKDAVYFKEEEKLLSYIVPFYLKPIKSLGNINVLRPASHESIFSTLYNLSLNNQEYLSFGQNLLDTYDHQCAFHVDEIIICDDGMIFNNDYFSWKDKQRGLVKKEKQLDQTYQKLRELYQSYMVTVDQYLKNRLELKKEGLVK